MKHGLLFERFLSEARVDGKSEPPDIDVDFEHERREEVLDYMYANYDREHAAITAVTQCFHAPTAVQDAMRALGYPVAQALEISKRVHGHEPAECIEAVKELAEARQIDLRNKRGEAFLMALEGYRGVGASPVDARGWVRAVGATTGELSARRADDDGSHDRAVRQG